MTKYDLIEYSNNYSKTSGSFCQYYRDEPFSSNNGAIAHFPGDNNNSASFKCKTEITSRIGNNGTKDVKIMVPLIYLNIFWRTLEMPLINCEINLILTWSTNFFIIDALIENEIPKCAISETKLSVPFETLSTQDNAKLLQQLKSGFIRTINWNKYQSKVTV